MKHDLSCSFCGATPSNELRRWFPGPGVSICSACVGAALQTILDGRGAIDAKSAGIELKQARCSFCRQPASNVNWMHSRNDRHICHRCLAFCVDIALEDKKPLASIVSL